MSQCRCPSPNKEERYVDSCPECSKKNKEPEEKKAYVLHGHTEHQGIPIAIENRKGSVRSGVDKDGKPWRTVMKHPYGYIKGTKGADGDEVDVYVGENKKATNAYVIRQKKDDGSFDEHKIMLGMTSKEDAKKSYFDHYDTKKYFGSISELPIERLKELLAEGKPLPEKLASFSLTSFLDELRLIGVARA